MALLRVKVGIFTKSAKEDFNSDSTSRKGGGGIPAAASMGLAGQPHLAAGAEEAAHVLHHPDDGQLHLVAEADLVAHVLE